jgi:hypothetical protein
MHDLIPPDGSTIVVSQEDNVFHIASIEESEEHNRLTKLIAETNAVVQSLPDQLAVWKKQCNEGIDKQLADAMRVPNANSTITKLFKDLEDESS